MSVGVKDIASLSQGHFLGRGFFKGQCQFSEDGKVGVSKLDKYFKSSCLLQSGHLIFY